MKKYICLALVAFFGTSIVSTIVAPPPATKHNHKNHKKDKDPEAHEDNTKK